jgi:hypothetical protein
MKKPRGDAKLKTQPRALQDEIFARLSRARLSDVRQWLIAEKGLAVSNTTLSEFYRWHKKRLADGHRRRRMLAATLAEVERQYDASQITMMLVLEANQPCRWGFNLHALTALANGWGASLVHGFSTMLKPEMVVIVMTECVQRGFAAGTARAWKITDKGTEWLREIGY